MLSIKQLSLAAAIATTFVVSAQANTVVVPSGNNAITWTKSASGSLNDLALTDRTAALVFIRPSTNGVSSADSSTNIALDGRFLTSLQDGHYSAGIVCAGDVKLSAIPTAAKINDLSLGAATLHLDAGETQYFLVGTEPNYTPVLKQITAEEAAKTLSAVNTYKQNHQISRVNADNCPAPAPKPAPRPAPVVVQPTPVVAVPAPQYYVETRPNVRLNILFDFDKSNIKAQYQDEVQKAANFLAKYADANVIVEGHTDSVGSDTYNQKLSERRANAVRNALVSNYGIAPSRIRAQGFGETRPVATNATAEGRQDNRRVMVVIPSE
ncbi:OmpA family protein [Moraxella nasovis]|uniref:OmpA family protein n=1 Tax=Moraxella nasovis TaxID=2904121 RepID=UPI001F6003CC|nr:OmpA family protein [Moraxella nasovis]UNU74236.1 OmpA family protein [Moraxella nasovis]